MSDPMAVVLAALIAAIPATFAVFWRTRKTANGFADHVIDELGQIKGLLTGHMQDERAHPKPDE